jgi:hypothetical protein
VREENNGVIAGSALASPVDDDSGIPGSDLSAITHADDDDDDDIYLRPAGPVKPAAL